VPLLRAATSRLMIAMMVLIYSPMGHQTVRPRSLLQMRAVLRMLVVLTCRRVINLLNKGSYLAGRVV